MGLVIILAAIMLGACTGLLGAISGLFLNRNSTNSKMGVFVKYFLIFGVLGFIIGFNVVWWVFIESGP